jgi:N-dimethylarginine dimethylaminohydrolase
MEIFDLPLDTTHLRHQIKWISYVKNTTFAEYQREVHRVLATDLGKMWARRRTIARLLEKYGIDVVPVLLRHGRVLGGGPHCITLDVRRKGNLENYFS